MKWLVALLCVLLLGRTDHAVAASRADCLSCHRERDARVVSSWAKSRHHQSGVACEVCHAGEHDGRMAARARRNEACTGCHGTESKSYFIAKHGVIAKLESGRMDFAQPLKDGNFRAPTCAYCHMHDGNHDVGAGVSPLMPTGVQVALEDRADSRASPCRDCHSPRFVETWFISGDRMVEIGRMKVREAVEVSMAHQDAAALAEARSIQQRMIEVSLRNVRLGVGHQSPDDQWWHGHPALDGDLLRIKAILGDGMLGRK